MGKRLLPLLALFVLCLPGPRALQANEVVLRLTNGGEMRGVLLNPDVPPAQRQTYDLKSPFGAKFAVAKDRVAEVVKLSALQLEYERIRPTYPDTVQGQWDLAEWCRERQLTDQRNAHLRRVIELDPDHERARAILGYLRSDGQWITRDALMTQRGYVKTPRGWELPQEVTLREERRKRELAEREWFLRMKQWRAWLEGPRADDARRAIAQIDDGHALKALARYLDAKQEKSEDVRLIMVEALLNINTPAACNMLVEQALFDPSAEVRITCMEKLGKLKNPDVARQFISYLRDNRNEIVNRAALALSYMDDPTAISPLIDALVTVHVKVIVSGGANQHAATFGSNGGATFSSGGSATRLVNTVANDQVRATLAHLTGQNFGFDKEQWRTWYNASRKAGNIDARRD